MVLHKIEENELIEYGRKPVLSECEIHDFLEKHPEILGKDIFIIGREVRTVDGNFIDLLGLNQYGDTVIIEIKKDQTPRKVIAQILEYAEWISTSIGSDELNKIAKTRHLDNYPSIWKKYETEFGTIPDLNERQQLYIIAEKIDPITERLARYLRKNGIDIFCMELNFYEKDGHKFCDTEIIVGKEKAIFPDISDSDSKSYDWRYYSERRGWSEDAITQIKKFVDQVLIMGKKQNWNLSVKFNRRYVAIQTKTTYNICALKERNGLVGIDLPALRNRSDPPQPDLDWQWSESQQFWQGNFAPFEIPSVDEMRPILEKAYNYRDS